ncbi:hypothetical protein RA263_29455, partial [Pseudomonas syringae pv. tagetis]|uniref:hypothetical protein n=1 Tax=Pseudomonas syringae group genomosp. 7 TaxID=251699 RepID=UPI00376F80C0
MNRNCCDHRHACPASARPHHRRPSDSHIDRPGLGDEKGDQKVFGGGVGPMPVKRAQGRNKDGSFL